MKILFLTQYFPPEVGAPQNRLLGLANELIRRGVEVTVLTAMPNYPQMKVYPGYKGKMFFKETMQNINIYRSWIYVSQKRTIIHRLFNYFSFVFSSLAYSFFIRQKFDYVLCESPPLFIGISGWLISKLKGAKFIFNVSDLWPESAEKLGIITSKLPLRLATRLEEFLYRKSFLITGQTQGIVKNISSRVPQKKTHWLPNGIDVEQFPNSNQKSVREEFGFSPDDFLLIYAGIIGHAQGLEVILKAAEHLKQYNAIRFILLGDGPEKENLLKKKEMMKLDNVFFHPSVPKAKALDIVSNCDATIVPLKKLELFLGALPSKIFEGLMLEKPLLLGVDGEARQLFIKDAQAGIYFEPENAEQLAEEILTLKNSPEVCRKYGSNGKSFVLENFTRSNIAKSFMNELEKSES